MKVLALNGSPRLKASSTYHMLENLLDGMEAAGAEVEIIHLRKLDIKSCIGCYTCWVRTPGECIFKDTMNDALAKYNQADMVVFGTPLYHFNMSGIMKNFIDRTLPRLEPWLIPHPDLADTTFHPERFEKPKKMMLVSPCGFPEFQHFDALVATFRQMAQMERMEYLGEILRPGAEAMSQRSRQELFTEYYALLNEAGKELIEQGSISSALAEELRKDIFPVEKSVFYELAEGYWTDKMNRFDVPEELRHTVPVLAADRDERSASPDSEGGFAQGVSNQRLMNYLAGMYNPAGIPELRATIQFVFAPPQDYDPGPARWFMSINEGVCEVHEGTTAVPSLVINTPHTVWSDIGSGKLEAETAFTDGLFEAEGSMELMAQFPVVFQYPQPEVAGGLQAELKMTMLGMPTVFSPEAATGLSCIIEYVLGGAGGGIYFADIRDGKCVVKEGSPVSADLTITAPASLWLAISKGERDGQEAFMAGDYRVNGDLNLLMKLGELFPR